MAEGSEVAIAVSSWSLCSLIRSGRRDCSIGVASKSSSSSDTSPSSSSLDGTGEKYPTLRLPEALLNPVKGLSYLRERAIGLCIVWIEDAKGSSAQHNSIHRSDIPIPIESKI